MIDCSTLPDQFPDVPADLSRMQAIFWSHWMKGNIPSANELSAPGTNELYARFKAQNSNPMKEAIAAKYKAEATIRRIAMQNPNFRPVKQTEVTVGVGKALDAGWTGQKQTATAIMREAANKEITEAYMSRTHQKGKLRAALAHHDNHPAVQYAKKQGNKIRVDADALSPGLSAIQDAAAVFRKLNDHEQRLQAEEAATADLSRRVAELEARLMSVETGTSLPEQAVAMRDAGKRQQEIATALGISVNTVKSWLRRSR
ncbi:sigma factor-like helix-turn-helix DNA-binding protein [Pantoea eucalypti]|uniref:sigma factor-like helix-turn-helix DNA-binding protein n=1 Tax=Pantoea eucalypti TaxID=470933 RepID=UPI003EE69DFF